MMRNTRYKIHFRNSLGFIWVSFNVSTSFQNYVCRVFHGYFFNLKEFWAIPDFVYICRLVKAEYKYLKFI